MSPFSGSYVLLSGLCVFAVIATLFLFLWPGFGRDVQVVCILSTASPGSLPERLGRHGSESVRHSSFISVSDRFKSALAKNLPTFSSFFPSSSVHLLFLIYTSHKYKLIRICYLWFLKDTLTYTINVLQNDIWFGSSLALHCCFYCSNRWNLCCQLLDTPT